MHQRDAGINLRAAVEARVSGHLVIARAGGVQLGTCGADAAGQFALDVHVHVLELLTPAELARIDVGLDAAQTALNGVELCLRQHPGAQLRASVGNAACNVVLVELPIVGDGLAVPENQIGGGL